LPNTKSNHITAGLAIVLLGAALSGIGQTAKSTGIRAAIQPENDRRAAAVFHLTDASGHDLSLSKYRGKVVLLDFWATTCGGCVTEIPWFIDLEREYRNKGLDVLGVSMDVIYEDLKNAQEGWSRVKPFVQAHRVNYPIVMGDDAVLKSWNIDAFPTTFLIDKAGRVAVQYVGIVDKANVEGNINALLNER
jgi:thiol-disulfide isomerase/thioredoxin